MDRRFPRSYTCREDAPRYESDDAARVDDLLREVASAPPVVAGDIAAVAGSRAAPPSASRTLADPRLVGSLTAAALSARRAEARHARNQARMLA